MGEPVRIADVAMKMIRLRGLRVDKDISVVYTGLRPGEKLHEALAADEERLERTRNEKIYHLRSQSSSPSLATVSAWISTLDRCLSTEDLASQRATLLALIRDTAAQTPVSVDSTSAETGLGAAAL